MARNISAQEAARRLAGAGFTFADRYAQGVEGKGDEWQRGAAGSVANYAAGIQKALAEKAFERGVQRASANRYNEGVRTKGVNNWPSGMQLAESRYVEGVQPFTGLWDQTLPTPRGPKGSPNNLKRMSENVARFQQAKK